MRWVACRLCLSARFRELHQQLDTLLLCRGSNHCRLRLPHPVPTWPAGGASTAMPCTLPLTGGGLNDKAAAWARLLPSCLAAAALLCLVLLANRRASIDPGVVSAAARA